MEEPDERSGAAPESNEASKERPRYPMHYVLGAVITREQADVVVSELTARGFLDSEVSVVSGPFHTKASPRTIVMALDPASTARRDTLAEANGRGLVSQQTPLQHGEQVYANFCAACHGAKGEGGVAKSNKTPAEALVAFIKNPTGAMARLLDEREVNAVATYVRTLQRP